MQNEYKPKYIGHRLLERGFKDWFLYIFKIIEKTPFIVEPIHEDLFAYFDKLSSLETKRLNINVPPRSAKTSLAKYFIAYNLAKNPRCNFIYTSFSQSLLSDISRSLSDLLENPVYKAMYDLSFNRVEEEVSPINSFWREYLQNETGKTKYNITKIVTPLNGVILFSSVGSAITGFGAGIRGAKEFSGCLIIDDANKPADISSKILTERTRQYYDETLLSRLNDFNVPIINIQQRLGLNDLAGYLIEKYNFETLKKPLIENGKCNLPSQYDDNRINELKQNDNMFQAQYQQEPMMDGGNLFKREWFNITDNMPILNKYEMIYATMDTAYNDKQINDYTVLSVWGLLENKLHLIEVFREKILSIDIPKMLEKVIFNYLQYKMGYVWIEPKSSGITLLQGFRRHNKIVKVPSEDDIKEYMKRDVNKVARANEILPFVNQNEPRNIVINSKIKDIDALIDELLFFPNGKHDDFVDTFVDGIRLGYRYYASRGFNLDKALTNMQNFYGFNRNENVQAYTR